MAMVANLLSHPWTKSLFGVALLVLAAALTGQLTQRLLARAMTAIRHRTGWRWDDAMLERGVFRWLGRVVPMLILKFGIALIPGLPRAAQVAVSGIVLALVTLFVVMALNAALSAAEGLYELSPRGRERSIKGYVQLLKIVVWLFGSIVIVACLVDRSAMSLLAGLGAISAVLLLIFKDTLLSVVASVQLASNDMLRVGDWISMPSAGVDGSVTDIALHTVKVQNWDMTISTIPTWRLISESFRNWRGMSESGGRRIERALFLDATSARFLEPDEVAQLKRFSLLDAYLAQKQHDLARWNDGLGEPGKQAVNRRRLTNLGSFRAYAQAYLDAHPKLNHSMTCMVRQLASGPNGIPMEIYCFTATTEWIAYEQVQGDIFDHLIAILPEFDLRLFQQPTGADIRSGLLAPAFPSAATRHSA